MYQPLQHIRLGMSCTILLALLGMPLLAAAQTHPCADVKDAAGRLTCYDKAFPPSPGVVSTLVYVEAQRRQAVADYGLNRQQLDDRRPAELRQIEPDRIDGIVKTVTERPTGERVVALESGQTWLLTEATSRGRLRPGDKVTIRDAAMGTHMLLTPKRVPLRAKRLN